MSRHHRHPYSRRRKLARDVEAEYGRQCHLCGRLIEPGEFSVDHLIPASIAPWLYFVLTNCRPAHKRCNSSRGNRTVPTRPAHETSRAW